MEIFVGECSLYSNYLAQSSLLFGVEKAFPHLFSALHPCKKHISGVGMSLIATAKIIKKHFLAHLCYLLMFSGIFSLSAISCSLHIGGLISYQHYILGLK